MEFIGICLITKDVMALTEFYCKIFNVGFEGDSTHTDIKNRGSRSFWFRDPDGNIVNFVSVIK
ncbi:hypothetical protein [Dethiothermospora halolimnae]|uniref:hypothetical protein n=1 Tax=Dethiothermospora halolimnae TaxID=3114390 RepID=UPI003CCB8F64